MADGVGQVLGYARGGGSAKQRLWDWKMEFQRVRFITRYDRKKWREAERTFKIDATENRAAT